MNVLVLENIIPDFGNCENKRKNPRYAVRRLSADEYSDFTNNEDTVGGKKHFQVMADTEDTKETIFNFLSIATQDNNYGFVLYENRGESTKIGKFKELCAEALLRVFIREFLSNRKNSSICTSFDKSNQLLHMDINSKTPLNQAELATSVLYCAFQR